MQSTTEKKRAEDTKELTREHSGSNLKESAVSILIYLKQDTEKARARQKQMRRQMRISKLTVADANQN